MACAVLSPAAEASPGYCMPYPDCNATLPSCPTGVAAYDSGTKTWIVDIDDGAGGNAPRAVVVSDFQVIGTTNCNTMRDHVAWGVTRSGSAFFCELTASTVDHVELHGTPEDDELCFQYANWGLQDTATTGTGSPPFYGPLDAVMEGYAGDDQMAGSWDDTDYSETLRARDDDDWVEGDWGDDVCVGEAGNDTVLGQGGDDRVGGNLDDDFVDGGPGTDHVCGNSGVDDARGNDGDNDLVAGGGNAGDTVDGGNGAGDQCGGGGGAGGCEGTTLTGLLCPL